MKFLVNLRKTVIKIVEFDHHCSVVNNNNENTVMKTSYGNNDALWNSINNLLTFNRSISSFDKV